MASPARPRTRSGIKRAPARRTPRKAAAKSRGLTPAECRLDSLSGEAEEARGRIESAGGLVLGAYSDPLGKNPLIVAILPIDSIEPTPFQRDLSQTHHRKLADVLHRTGMFLDPVIAVTAPKEGFWTPNGRHRLEAMRRLGARSITALVMPGVCYEKNGKFAGGAYNPIVRRLEKFSDEPLSAAIKAHERHAAMLMDLDSRVAEVIAKLKDRGFVSPYLRAFVVARINPLRWIQGEPPPLEEVLKTMRERAAKFNTEKIKQEDLAGAGGAPDEPD